MKGNRPVESYIGQDGYEWMPPSRIIDELVVKSIPFCLPRKNRTKYVVRNARLEDIPDIVLLLNREHQQRDFGLVFHEDDFQSVMQERGLKIENYFVAVNNKGKIKGVCLAWDCTSFRRTKVLKYSADFYPLLWTYKALEKFLTLAPFPANNGSFRELTITDYASEDRDVIVMNALLSEVYHRYHNGEYHFMNFASCLSDPLLKAANSFLHRNVISHIIFTSLDKERFNIRTQLPFVDIAFL